MRLEDLSTDNKLTYFKDLYEGASRRLVQQTSTAATGRRKTASVASLNTVSKLPVRMFRFCIWVRNVEENSAKNMDANLLQAILEEICSALAAYAELQALGPLGCELILLGDPNGIKAPEKLPSSAAIQQSLLEMLVKEMKNSTVSVVDLRGFVEMTGGEFSKFHGSHALPPFDSPVPGVGAVYELPGSVADLLPLGCSEDA